MKSKTLAVSAISASFITLFLTIGSYFTAVDVFCVFLASAFVIAPLYCKSYTGSFLSFLVGGLLYLILSGFNFLTLIFPSYFLFFGIFPIIKVLLQEKKVNFYLAWAIKLVWAILAIYAIYFYYTAFVGPISAVPEWLQSSFIYLISVCAIIICILFDRCISIMQFLWNKYLSKVIK